MNRLNFILVALVNFADFRARIKANASIIFSKFCFLFYFIHFKNNIFYKTINLIKHENQNQPIGRQKLDENQFDCTPKSTEILKSLDGITYFNAKQIIDNVNNELLANSTISSPPDQS
ncbi:hypothetical protein [Pedobacter hartonius]|uniref:hypothetical protein n=1 Tax=Pedobacter hartonius TaxID=425514 RepID=UPI000B82A526|nr:hypothetical protein [Pedobacter hartonius]